MEQEVPHSELDLWQLYLLVPVIGSLVLEICAPAPAPLRSDVTFFCRLEQLLALSLVPGLAASFFA
jgi:hypothetical protein